MQCAISKKGKHLSSVPGKEIDVLECDDDSTYSKFNGSQSSKLSLKRSKSIYSYAADDFSPFGCEGEGLYSNDEVSGSSSGVEHNTSPSCLSWASDFYKLLDDPHGVKLFQLYLKQEDNSQAEMLKFLFALRGLRNKEKHKQSSVRQIIKTIYSHFFHKTKLAVPIELLADLRRKMKENKNMLRSDIFNEIQIEVEERLKKTGYVSFLMSDVYLKHIRAVKAGEICCSGGSDSSSDERDVSRTDAGKTVLPTLREDVELISPYKSHYAVQTLQHIRSKPVRTLITKAVVHRPEPEELTDNEVPYKEIIKVVNANKIKEGVVYYRLTEHLAAPEGEPVVRSQIIESSYKDFAASLITKLEVLKKQQEGKEGEIEQEREEPEEQQKCEEKQQREIFEYQQDSNRHHRKTKFATVITEKLQEREDADYNQTILDEHVSRVWSDVVPSHQRLLKPGLESSSIGVEQCQTQTCPPKYQDMQGAPEGSDFVFLESPNNRFHSKKDYSSVFSSDSERFVDLPEEEEGELMYNYCNPPRSSRVRNYQEAHYAVSGGNLKSYLSKETINSKHSSGYFSCDNRDSTFTLSSWSSSSTLNYSSKQSTSTKKKILPTLKESSTVNPSSLPPVSQTDKRTDYTIAIISFSKEDLPYRVKIPGQSVTLRQFKEFLPKKGKCQYFFKTEWNEDDIKAVRKEIKEDDEILPLWKGVIMAQVQNMQ